MAAMNSALKRRAEWEQSEPPAWEAIATEWDEWPEREQAEASGRRLRARRPPAGKDKPGRGLRGFSARGLGFLERFEDACFWEKTG